MDEATLSKYEKLFIAATRVSAALNKLEEEMNDHNLDIPSYLDREWEQLTDCIIGASEDPVMTDRLPELQDLT